MGPESDRLDESGLQLLVPLRPLSRDAVIYEERMVSTPLILVVGNEPDQRRQLRAELSTEGYAVMDAGSCSEAIAATRKDRPDLIVLDIDPHKLEALETCREIRRRCGVRIVALLENGGAREIVDVLETGADDCIAKPVGTDELVARMQNALRHSAFPEPESHLFIGQLEIDFERRTVNLRGKTAHLTPKQFELLRYLLMHHGRTLSHRNLIDAVWGLECHRDRHHLRGLINDLRRKLEPDPTHPQYLLTDAWFGYRFDIPPGASCAAPAIGDERRTQESLRKRE